MKIYKSGRIVINKTDRIKRRLIVFTKYAIDYDANKWFVQYINDHDIDSLEAETVLQDILKYFADERNETDASILDVFTFTTDNKLQQGERADSRTYKYTMTGENGQQAVFNEYNGFFYTSKTNQLYVIFEYGDFYCMESIFPLAAYLLIQADITEG